MAMRNRNGNEDHENEDINGDTEDLGDGEVAEDVSAHEMNLKYIAIFTLFYGVLVSVAGLVTTFI